MSIITIQEANKEQLNETLQKQEEADSGSREENKKDVFMGYGKAESEEITEIKEAAKDYEISSDELTLEEENKLLKGDSSADDEEVMSLERIAFLLEDLNMQSLL